MEAEYISKHHKHQQIGANQCTSCLTKRIQAPIDIVWSLVRRFDQPQRYKPFISECNLRGDFKVGTVREVNVRSGLPATKSTERLELLDDEQHILGVRITGGDHRLKVIPFKISLSSSFMSCLLSQYLKGSSLWYNEKSIRNCIDRLATLMLVTSILQNYSSVITVHPETINGMPGTLLIESFVVDVPDGNTIEDTCCFIEALINCNLNCLADVSEKIASGNNPDESGHVVVDSL